MYKCMKDKRIQHTTIRSPFPQGELCLGREINSSETQEYNSAIFNGQTLHTQFQKQGFRGQPLPQEGMYSVAGFLKKSHKFCDALVTISALVSYIQYNQEGNAGFTAHFLCAFKTLKAQLNTCGKSLLPPVILTVAHQRLFLQVQQTP